MGFFRIPLHCSLMVKACFIIYSVNALAADSEEERLNLLHKAEGYAILDVLSPADLAFFKRVSAIPLLQFISPMEVMGYKTRKKIMQRTIEIIQVDIAKFYNHETTKLKASEELYLAVLKQAETQQNRKLNKGYQLEKFKRYLQEHKEKSEAVENKKTISLYEASQIIERWGVDPYDFSARPYYCALGIHALEMTGGYATRFCS